MDTINHEHVRIALDKAEGSKFEGFFHAFCSAVFGIEFVPLGGTHDGGADAFHESAPGFFYQASTQKDFRAKIRQTVSRLKDSGRDPKNLTYVTSRGIPRIDKEEEKLSAELGIPIRIRDEKWIATHINDSPQTIAAFGTYLEPYLSYLGGFGSAKTVGESSNMPDRTLCVFLGQEVDRQSGNTNLLEAVTDSLILWGLKDTDPDAGKFMTRDAIRAEIETALPSAKHFIRGNFNHRIKKLSIKHGSTGREVRWYKREDKFCLPYETRKMVRQENSEDESLKLQVLELYRHRAEEYCETDDTLLFDQISNLAHRALELTFEQEGLELAEFLTDEYDGDPNFTISDQIDKAIDEVSSLAGNNVVRAKDITMEVLKQAFYSSTEVERLYYGKLSRTYALMLTLRNEPKIVEYFKNMSSRFVLFVGTDIIVRALSERFLSDTDQMTTNMLRILQEARSTLYITHMTVEEVHAHIKTSNYAFENYFRGIEPYMDKDIVRHSNKILIRAYFYAKLNPVSGKTPPDSWKMYIEQICSHDKLEKNNVSRNEIKGYLIEKFGFKYLDEADIEKLADDAETEELAEQIRPAKSDDVLAFNDARHILAVYGKRKDLGENHHPTPYGLSTWWLTHKTKVLHYTKDLVTKRSSRYIIRPEFILNFVALSPTTADVRKSYNTVFPTLLGISLSNRMRPEIFDDVMEKCKEIANYDPARRKVKMNEMSTHLKGDNYKQYENEFADLNFESD